MITVQRAVPAKGVPAARSLHRWARAALRLAPAPGSSRAGRGRARGELTLRIVGPAESRALNRRFRGKDKPTNVLSFPYDDQGVLGDLVICAPVVQRESREQHKPPAAHWAHMVVHGVLHLLGYDHIKPSDARRMEARERAILATFDIPDPYLIPK